MSWLYDDQDLVQQPPSSITTPTAVHPAHDFELFHEHVAPVDVGQTDIQPVASDQGIKHVRVRNLQWWTNENTLRDILADCGEVKSIEFESSMKNGKSLGIANIEFETSDAALRAIDMIDNHEIDGKPVNASLLVVEDVKVSVGAASQRQHQLPNNQQPRKPTSPKRPVKSPSRATPAVQEPALDHSRQQNKLPSRDPSTARAGEPANSRQDVAERGSQRDTDRTAYYGRSHSYSSHDHKDRDHAPPGSTSSSRHDHQSHRRESQTRRDKDRLGPVESTRTSRSELHRDSSKSDSHHPKDSESSRRSSYNDDKYSAHLKRSDSERGSRDSRPDYARSHARSHRIYDEDRGSKRSSEFSIDYGSSYDRHRNRHDLMDLEIRNRHQHHHDSDSRLRKKRR